MRKLVIATAAAAGLALPLAAPAQAAVLTFDGNICSGVGGPCVSGSVIDQTYGDAANVDVQYNYDITNALYSRGGANSGLRFWSIQYSELTNVAWGGQDDNTGTPEIFLQPIGGSVTLNGFDLGSWPNVSRTSQVTIVDGANNVLFSSGQILVDGNVHTHFSFALTSNNGIGIQWGPSGFDVGIDNVDFSVGPYVTGGVPEPGTWALMLIGVGTVGAMARASRRRVRTAA